MGRMMFRGLLLALLGAALPFTAISVPAQEGGAGKNTGLLKTAPEEKAATAYRVEYTIREMEGNKAINTRKYMLMAASDQVARTRVGSRVPIVTGDMKQVQYQDVGMNIDCRVDDRGDQLLLHTTVESSSVAAPEGSSVATSTGNPVFRRVNSTVTAAVTLGKPTIVGSMDDVTSNHRYEIEVTVIQVK